jgi:diguanylate cyclase (GGDEF)-like protein
MESSSLPISPPERRLQPTRAVRLLVCDHRGSRLSEKLRLGHSQPAELTLTSRLRESLLALASQDPDVLLLDPLSATGRAELEVIEPERVRLDVPMLVVHAGLSGRDLLSNLKALRAEHFDLIERSAPLDEYWMRIQRLLEERRARREIRELRHRAAHDERTDLLRAGAFQARLGEHFSAAQRHGLPLALVLMDLDSFGQINKLHDHTIGDEVIQRVAEAVRRALRVEDIAGRLGGDEFAVVLPYTKTSDAARVSERLREEIHRLTGSFGDGRALVRVAASLGYETFDGRDLNSVSELRQHAERALRQAKARGGNMAIYYRTLLNSGGPEK